MRVFVKRFRRPIARLETETYLSKLFGQSGTAIPAPCGSDKTAAAKQNKGQNGSENRPPMHCPEVVPGIAHRATSEPPASRDRGLLGLGQKSLFRPGTLYRKVRGKR